MSTSLQPSNTDLLGRISTALSVNAVTILVAIAGVTLSPAFHALYLLVVATTLAIMIRGGFLWYRYRNPSRPRKPRPKRARLAWRLPFHPAKEIPLLSSNCVICGRPLTNPQSMRARVGTTCIKKYGPRYANRPNPAYVEWQKRKAEAESARDAEQAKLDAQYESALANYTSLMLAWETEVASPEGQSRQTHRKVGQRIYFVGGLSTLFVIALALLAI